MIKSKNGIVKAKGTKDEIGADFGCIVTLLLNDVGFSKEQIRFLVSESIAGVERNERKKDH